MMIGYDTWRHSRNQYRVYERGWLTRSFTSSLTRCEMETGDARRSPTEAPMSAPAAAPLPAVLRLNNPPIPAPIAANTAAYFARLNPRLILDFTYLLRRACG